RPPAPNHPGSPIAKAGLCPTANWVNFGQAIEERAVRDRPDWKQSGQAESPYAWFRLAASLVLSTIGGIGMWSFVVALPAGAAGFRVGRAPAAPPFTPARLGVGVWGGLIGRVSHPLCGLGPV